MAEDTFMKSQAMTQPLRAEGSRQEFIASQNLGASIGQAAQNYVQNYRAEQELSMRGAIGREQMLTEQLRREEIEMKMGMMSNISVLQLQKEQARAARLQNDMMEKQMEESLSPEEQYSQERATRYMDGTFLDKDGNYYAPVSGGRAMMDEETAMKRIALKQQQQPRYGASAGGAGAGGPGGLNTGAITKMLYTPAPTGDGMYWMWIVDVDENGQMGFMKSSPMTQAEAFQKAAADPVDQLHKISAIFQTAFEEGNDELADQLRPIMERLVELVRGSER